MPRFFVGDGILFGQEHLRRWRQARWGSLTHRVLQALRRKAHAHGHLLETLDDATLLGDHRVVEAHLAARQFPGLDDLALIGVLDHQTSYLDTVIRVLRLAADADARSSAKQSSFAFGSGRYLPVAFDLARHAMAAGERRNIARWLARHGVAEFVERQGGDHLLAAGSNRRILGLVSAILCSLVVRDEPAVPACHEHQPLLLRLLQASLYATIGPNGYPAEDIGYGTAVVALLAQAVEAVRRAGWWDGFADCPRLRSFGRAMLHFVQPWGQSLSITGDHGDSFADRALVLGRLALLNQDPSLAWLMQTLRYPSSPVGQWSELGAVHPELTLGPGQQIPISGMTLLVVDALRRSTAPSRLNLPRSFVDPGRGIVSLRSGWRRDDLLVIVDGSQRSAAVRGHEHASAGHFSLSAVGEIFALDMGRYSMDRAHHNVVTIAGHEDDAVVGGWTMARSHGRLIGCQQGEHCDWVSVDASQQANCAWSFRHVGLIRAPRGPAYIWVVDDVNLDDGQSGPRLYQWRLHLCPGSRASVRNGQPVVEGARSGQHLDVHAHIAGAGRRTSGVHWSQRRQRCGSPTYITPEILRRRLSEYRRAPLEMSHGPVFQCPLLLGAVRGLHLRMLTLLIPRRRDAAPSQVQVCDSPPNVITVEIAHGRVTDRLVWAFDHGQLGPDLPPGLWRFERRVAGQRVIACQHEG